jgi:hypothetical protein
MGYRDSSEAGWERAVDLCVVEVAQPRPWVKKLVTESTQAPTSLEVSSPETRAVFWSTIEYPFADAVLAEIESGSDFAAPGEDLNAYLRLTRKISSGSVNTVRHTVASIPLRGERKNLHFVRVEDNVSSGVYIDAEMERSSFYSQASSGFVPHPLI